MDFGGNVLVRDGFGAKSPVTTGIRSWLLFLHLKTSLIVYFRLAYLTSEENSECVIGKSRIEFDLTYSLLAVTLWLKMMLMNLVRLC